MSITQTDLITNNFVLPLWNERSLEVIDYFFSPTATIQTTFGSGIGPDILKRSVQETFIAFPTLEFKMDDIFQRNHQIIYEWQANAIHEGSVLGIPKTGLAVNFKEIVLGEIQNGLIIRYTSYSNIPQVLRNAYEISIVDPQCHLRTELQKITQFPLTRREIECLGCWLKGYSIKETAKQMGGLSARTIQTYRENIKKKFNVYSFQKIFSTIQCSGIMPLFLEEQYAINT